MIRGFFDESSDSVIFLAAGWVADYEMWQAFSDDWRNALESRPTIGYFKHHEATGNPPTGEFEGWDAQQVDDKMSLLTEVICRHQMYGAVSGLNIAKHAAMFKSSIPRKQVRSVIKTIDPYHSCVFSVSALVLQVEVDNGNTQNRVDLVFDESNGLLGECVDVYKRVKEFFPPDKRGIAGTISEANDKDVVALQAADFLAGQRAASDKYGCMKPYYQRMNQAHIIYDSEAYLPSLDLIPEMMKCFEVVWSRSITSKRNPSC